MLLIHSLSIWRSHLSTKFLFRWFMYLILWSSTNIRLYQRFWAHVEGNMSCVIFTTYAILIILLMSQCFEIYHPLIWKILMDLFEQAYSGKLYTKSFSNLIYVQTRFLSWKSISFLIDSTCVLRECAIYETNSRSRN